jgi:cytochrome P450
VVVQVPPEYELFTVDFWKDPAGAANWWREHQPVHHHERSNSWILSRHADIVRASTDVETFSNEGVREASVTGEAIDQESFETQVNKRRLSSRDKPSHTELRRLMMKPFTPRSIAQREDDVREVCESVLDEMEQRGAAGDLDLVRDFSYPIPVLAVNLILGVPNEVRWSVGRYTNTTEREMAEYFRTLVEDPRFKTGEDLTSVLVSAAATGNRYITPEEVHYFVAAFWTAGNLTTTNLMAHMMVQLDQLPGVRDELEADRSLIPGFVEESLRVEPPVPGVLKLTKKDADFDGTVIPAGSRVYVFYTAANRDPAVFTDPDTFDLHRSPNPHLSFAHGAHFCLGAPLARLEARVAIETVLDRDFRYSVTADRVAGKGGPGPTLNGFEALPATRLP